ncbi:hypothetical protein K3F96_15030 [Acinetobacter baumannii]|uniref:hypothetical protein n=1 Tax=Acinetobacter baumannii TaxID=470 RepID=UPI00234241E7|nr:hypothetical protein [Acinetobacter baumannii]MDC4023182.1 hypothetical protein [Acinetobacter baumannii]MDC4059806.1 hypothetical protein [Acinetobacter baumannii]MDC4117039.1 hypothetical protein [Acinetobacter baumannii]MDC4121433.1 hypothetical protein [Acinetobacter baumannii]MDC4135621.1 hypothetical protein [Acinetobacter baumannii]
MSRLQQGGLALSIENGSVVTLVKFMGDCFEVNTGEKYFSVWHVRDSSFQVTHTGSLEIEYGVESKYLVPLGDEKGIEIHKLREEHEVIA